MKTVLLVGAGSIKNGWDPIHTALNSLYPRDFKKENRVELANLIMAKQVYLARFEIQYLDNNISGEKPLVAIDELNRIKQNISNELQLSSKNNTISVQAEFDQVANITSTGADQLKLISTNWDHVFDNALIKYLGGKGIRATNNDILHLHGEMTFPETMYLPSELLREPYRNSEHEKELGKRHAAFLKYLEQADRLIIYGLSLSALDAELTQMIAAGISESILNHIIIIDPNHSVILDKIKTLYGSTREVKIDSVWNQSS